MWRIMSIFVGFTLSTSLGILFIGTSRIPITAGYDMMMAAISLDIFKINAQLINFEFESDIEIILSKWSYLYLEPK